MKKNLSSLWSPNEETKKKSKLELFCRHLEKKQNELKIKPICPRTYPV